MATTERDFANAPGVSPRPVPRESIWRGGPVAGIIAGIIMAIVSMLITAAMGMGFWLVPKMIAATFLGVDALVGGAGAVILGVIVHLIVSAILGLIFAFLTPRIISASSDFGLGIVFGVVVWAVMTFIVLPLINDVMRDRVALMPFAWFIEHLVFGGSLALTPYFERISAPEAYRRAIARGPTAAPV